MEYVNCNICGSEKTKFVYEKKEKLGIVPDIFRIIQCANCGLMYISPRPAESEIKQFYPETYSWKKDIPTKFGIPVHRS